MWHLILNVFILIPKLSSLGVSCSYSLWHVKTPSLQWSCSPSSYHASRFCKALSSQISLFPKRTRYLLKAGNNRTHEGLEKCSHRIECYVNNSFWISENYSWHNFMFCFPSKQDARIIIVVCVFLLFVHVFLTLSCFPSKQDARIIIVVCVFLLFVHVFLTLSMYSYCGVCILIVRPCILIVVYVYLLLSMYS